MLFDMQGEHYRLAWELIAIMSFLTLSFFVLVISLAVKSQRKKIVSGQEGLVGETGVVMNARNEHYMVRVAGEMWEAKCSSTLKNGDKVRVTHSKGLLLTITPVEKSGE